MTTSTIGYLAWQANGQAFCVHPAPYIVKIGGLVGCRQCGTTLANVTHEKV